MITSKRLQQALVFLSVLIAGGILYAQNPVSLFQLGSTAVDTNSGAKSAGTLRVVVATDQPQLTNALKVDGSATTQPVSGTVTANAGTGNFTVVNAGTFAVQAAQSGTWTVQPGNTANTTAWKVDGSAVTQPISGTVTANMGTVTADPFGANADAASATGSISAKLRFIAGTGIPITGTVTVGSHNVTNAGTFATQAAQSGTWTVQPGNTANTTAWLVGTADPCNNTKATPVSFSFSTATTTQLIAASASNYNYICAFDIVTAGANNIALVEDDTSACASPTAGMAGGTTAATGWNLAANGGLTKGNGGGTVFKTAATNRYTCLISSAAVQVSGSIMYVQAP